MKLRRSYLVPFAVLVGLGFACGDHRAPAVGSAAMAADTTALEPGGVGSIQTRTEHGDAGKLRLQRVSVKAKQAGDMAEVVVEHTFVSEATVPLEGTFRFPMPDGAIVTGLAMMVDGQMMEGELVENDKARKIYEEIVDAMQDPALMEWEHGQTFKMRVFPIEPGKPKVVAMRYLTPLRKKEGGAVFVQGTRAIDDGDAIPELRLEWEGKERLSLRDVGKGRLLEAPAAPPASALREVREDGTYTTVRLSPDWSKVPAKRVAPPKNWVVVADTSRSSLEERKLEVESLRKVLEGLDAESRFVFATSDLDTKLSKSGFVKPSPATIGDAMAMLESTPPDGATNLGEMLHVAGAAAAGAGNAGVIYIGDCEASWGATDVKALRDRAAHDLAGAPFYPLVLGSAVDVELARELAAVTAGRMFRAGRPEDVAAFAADLRRTKKRLSNVEIVQVPGSVILPVGKMTLDEGEELVALVRTPTEEKSPAAIVLRSDGEAGTQETSFPVQPRTTAMVARRFGAAWVRELERQGKPKEEIVQASLAFTVMSKHTSFLVLDSEEAYEKYKIERRAKRQNQAVSGTEALGADVANISLDRIQPGDPEILVDAPADAEDVVVVLPTGETKIATYDREAKGGRGAWMVRFLVERGTPEGTYEARAFVQYKDGHRETRTVHYTVDTTVPLLVVEVVPALGKPGALEIRVTQQAPKAEVDTRRVEVRTPDGQTLALTAVRWGEFRGLWSPRGGREAVAGQMLHVVGFDQALNHTTLDVPVP